jgi:hypothetical protein
MNKDVLYYSNYCKHSKTVLDQLVKNNIIGNLNCICVDKRKVDPNTGNINVILENGNAVVLPPNIHSVPSLLVIRNNYSVITGKEILQHFQMSIAEANDFATQGNGEPSSFQLGSKDVTSESFTMYNASPDDLSAKGIGGNRPLNNYVAANGGSLSINTPPDTYKPDKISNDLTVESLSQQRNNDIQHVQSQQPSFMAAGNI